MVGIHVVNTVKFLSLLTFAKIRQRSWWGNWSTCIHSRNHEFQHLKIQLYLKVENNVFKIVSFCTHGKHLTLVIWFLITNCDYKWFYMTLQKVVIQSKQSEVYIFNTWLQKKCCNRIQTVLVLHCYFSRHYISCGLSSLSNMFSLPASALGHRVQYLYAKTELNIWDWQITHLDVRVWSSTTLRKTQSTCSTEGGWRSSICSCAFNASIST